MIEQRGHKNSDSLPNSGFVDLAHSDVAIFHAQMMYFNTHKPTAYMPDGSTKNWLKFQVVVKKSVISIRAVRNDKQDPR